MKFTTKFYAASLDMKRYRRALLKHLVKWNMKAGQAWVNAAVNTTPIPTWSGASRATFQKLANELGTTVPIGPIRSRNSRVSLGQSTSAGSGVVINKQLPYVGFVYKTSLRYLHYNNYNKATQGRPPRPFSNNVRFTPYRFHTRAKQAWEKVASKYQPIDPSRYLKKRKM